MKRIHWFVMLLCLAMMPALQSCSDDDGYSVGDFTPPLWATVRVTGATYYLDCDVWGTLCPVNTDLGWYVPVDGQRVITYFNPLWDDYAGYDHAVKILGIQNVLTKQVETLTPENEEEFGNDPVTIYQGDITISGGYMNIIFVQNLPAKEKHRGGNGGKPLRSKPLHAEAGRRDPPRDGTGDRAYGKPLRGHFLRGKPLRAGNERSLRGYDKLFLRHRAGRRQRPVLRRRAHLPL